MKDFSEMNVSDAGPKYPVMVYQRMTGNVIWEQPWYMPYFLAIRKAKRMISSQSELFKRLKERV